MTEPTLSERKIIVCPTSETYPNLMGGKGYACTYCDGEWSEDELVDDRIPAHECTEGEGAFVRNVPKEANVVGSEEYEPFRIYARGEKRPFDQGGDDPVVQGAMRWAPISDDGMVTLSAEALRDLCNHVYRQGWRFGNLVGLGEECPNCNGTT